jgi:hypothetical protein
MRPAIKAQIARCGTASQIRAAALDLHLDYVERARSGAAVGCTGGVGRIVFAAGRKVRQNRIARGMKKTLIVTVAALTASLLTAWQPAAHAEMVLVDGKVQVADTDTPRPKGGMTMAAVEARFGSPRERHETVGTPPITRWDYEHFSVFFEKDRVIDAVVPVDASASSAAPASTSASQTPEPAPAASPGAAPKDAPAAPAPAATGLINIVSGAAASATPAPQSATASQPTSEPASKPAAQPAATPAATPDSAPAAAPAP